MAATSVMKLKRSLKIQSGQAKNGNFISNIEKIKSQNAIDSIQDVYLTFTSEHYIENTFEGYRTRTRSEQEMKDIVKLLSLFHNTKKLEIEFEYPVTLFRIHWLDFVRILLCNIKEMQSVKWITQAYGNIIAKSFKRVDEDNTVEVKLEKNGNTRFTKTYKL